jgi:hypothetical protein
LPPLNAALQEIRLPASAPTPTPAAVAVPASTAPSPNYAVQVDKILQQVSNAAQQSVGKLDTCSAVLWIEWPSELERLQAEGFLQLPDLRKLGGRGVRRIDVSTVCCEPVPVACAARECEPLELVLVEGQKESRRRPAGITFQRMVFMSQGPPRAAFTKPCLAPEPLAGLEPDSPQAEYARRDRRHRL